MMFRNRIGMNNKKHLKNVGPIRYCEPPHAHSPGVACASMSTTTPDNDDDDNANA